MVTCDAACWKTWRRKDKCGVACHTLLRQDAQCVSPHCVDVKLLCQPVCPCDIHLRRAAFRGGTFGRIIGFSTSHLKAPSTHVLCLGYQFGTPLASPYKRAAGANGTTGRQQEAQTRGLQRAGEARKGKGVGRQAQKARGSGRCLAAAAASRPLKAFPLTVLVAALSCSAVGAKPETDDAVQGNDLAAHRCVPD